MLYTKEREKKRIRAGLEATVLAGSLHYPAFTENISEEGLCLRIAYCSELIQFLPGEVLKLTVTIPSGEVLNLRCREIWSQINSPSSMMKVSGMEIIDPPPLYRDFVHALRGSLSHYR